MKLHDIVFIVILGILSLQKNRNLFVYTGILSLVLSIPLFAYWIFFSAQRLTWYAAAFFLIASFI